MNDQQTRNSMTKTLNCTLISIVSIVLCSCSAPSAITTDIKKVESLSYWQNSYKYGDEKDGINPAVSLLNNENLLKNFNNQTLITLVELALKNNHNLKAQQSALAIAEQQMQIVGATNYPDLSLDIGNSRRKTINITDSNYQNSADISVKLSYEIDVWGKLSAQQQQASLSYQSQESTYQQTELTLITSVVSAWFDLIEAKQLLSLFTSRAKNLENNLEMIQSSYRLGLNDALDVYLTQNNVSSEQARVIEQQQTVKIKQRNLELLLGQTPKGLIDADSELPVLFDEVDTGLPSQLLTKRADISSSWYKLLALDADLAVAHKARFPRFSISASTSDSGSELTDLLNGNSLAWSLIGNITTPLFNAGKLESLEEQARLKVVQQEQNYLALVYKALAETQNAIDNVTMLKSRYQLFENAQENAIVAENLSFNQYLRGLVTYTTVLESQRRAFDAQTSLIKITNQLIQNRINLYAALGGKAINSSAQLTQYN